VIIPEYNACSATLYCSFTKLCRILCLNHYQNGIY